MSATWTGLETVTALMGSTPPAAAPAPPRPYGLTAMLEETLTLAFRAPAVFAAAARRPAPAYMLMLANLLVFSAAAYGVNFLKSAISMAALAHYSPAVLLFALSAGLLLALPASFAAAALLHALMLAAGGTAGFARSFQIISLSSALIVLQAMLNWFEITWALPSLLAAYLCITAAEALHGAPRLRAVLVFCLAGAAVLSGQWWLRGRFRGTTDALEAVPDLSAAARTADRSQDADERLQKLQGLDMPLDPAGESRLSGLDLLSGPPGAGKPYDPRQQAQAIQQAASGMLAPINAMLNDPRVTRNMSPEQARQFRELTAMLARMQRALAEGKAVPAQEQADMMRRFQSLAMQIMSQPPSLAPAGTPARDAARPGGGAAAAASGDR